LDSIIAFLAEYFYLGVVALALVVILWFYRRRLPELAIAGVIIAGLSYLLSILATDLISDPRPFIQTGIAPLIQSATDNGFPSDHTLLLGIVAAVITLASWRTGLIFWGLALLVWTSQSLCQGASPSGCYWKFWDSFNRARGLSHRTAIVSTLAQSPNRS